MPHCQATNYDMKQGNIAEYNCIFLFKTGLYYIKKSEVHYKYHKFVSGSGAKTWSTVKCFAFDTA